MVIYNLRAEFEKPSVNKTCVYKRKIITNLASLPCFYKHIYRAPYEAIVEPSSLLRICLGPHKMSGLKRCPYFRGGSVHFFMYVSGTVDSVLIKDVSLCQR